MRYAPAFENEGGAIGKTLGVAAIDVAEREASQNHLIIPGHVCGLVSRAWSIRQTR
jgi:hypothetical protein